jgi:hypothetical protein
MVVIYKVWPSKTNSAMHSFLLGRMHDVQSRVNGTPPPYSAAGSRVRITFTSAGFAE